MKQIAISIKPHPLPRVNITCPIALLPILLPQFLCQGLDLTDCLLLPLQRLREYLLPSGRERGRGGGRERGRGGGGERGREGGREREGGRAEGGREGESVRKREGGRKGGRECKVEGGREGGGREGGRGGRGGREGGYLAGLYVVFYSLFSL